MTSIKYDHLQVMGTITGKFHQNPLKTVRGVAETRTSLDGQMDGQKDGRMSGDKNNPHKTNKSKGLKGAASIPTNDLVAPDRCTRNHQIPLTDIYRSSFFPQTIRHWNSLTVVVVVLHLW